MQTGGKISLRRRSCAHGSDTRRRNLRSSPKNIAQNSRREGVPAYMKTVAARLAAGENVTLLYGAKDPKINQAVVLRDWMLHRMDK